jgi:hypothetical protein
MQLLAAAPKDAGGSRRVRFTRSTQMRDAGGAFWAVDAGDELDLTPVDAQRAIAVGDCVEVPAKAGK